MHALIEQASFSFSGQRHTDIIFILKKKPSLFFSKQIENTFVSNVMETFMMQYQPKKYQKTLS